MTIKAKTPPVAPTRRSLLSLMGLGAAALGVGCAGASEARHLRPPAGDRLTADDMVGKLLRVIRPGEFVTQEFSPDRVTIEVDENNRISLVRIG